MIYVDEIFSWEFYVENVNSMWLGICGGQHIDLLSAPPNYRGEHLLAFHSSGEPKRIAKIGMLPTIEKVVDDSSFSSGDRIKFSVNPIKKSLVMRINGITTYRVTNLEMSESNSFYRAFVSMRYNESTTLCSSELFKNQAFDDDQLREDYIEARQLGLNHKLWSSELDTKIKGCWPKGICFPNIVVAILWGTSLFACQPISIGLGVNWDCF